MWRLGENEQLPVIDHARLDPRREPDWEPLRETTADEPAVPPAPLPPQVADHPDNFDLSPQVAAPSEGGPPRHMYTGGGRQQQYAQPLPGTFRLRPWDRTDGAGTPAWFPHAGSNWNCLQNATRHDRPQALMAMVTYTDGNREYQTLRAVYRSGPLRGLCELDNLDVK